MTRVLLALGLSLGLGAFAFTAEPALGYRQFELLLSLPTTTPHT